MSNMTNQFKIPFIIMLILTFATCKSITTNAKTSENSVAPIVRQQLNAGANQNAANEATTQNNTPTEPSTSPVTIIPTNGTDGVKRNERTVYHLRVVDNPSQVIENFRNKLKSARTHLQEVNRKTIPPKYIINPNQENQNLKTINVPITMPVNVKRVENTPVEPSADLEAQTGFKQVVTQPKTTVNKPLITKPTKEASKEEIKPQKIESSNDTVASALDCSSEISPSDPTVGNAKETEELDHLLHMREEISKLRNIMQGIKEKQVKERIKNDFAKQPNLTEDQHDQLLDFAKHEHLESREKIAKDVSNLKDIVQKFTKRMEVNKIRDENYDKLQEKIRNQQEEIEHLRKQVKIPQAKPSTILTPIPVTEELSEERNRLLDELKHLQDSLSDITNQEKRDSVLGSAPLEQKEDPTLKSEHEMETLLDLFHTITKPTNPKLLASKLDKLERDLDDLDEPKPVKRQDSILEKLKEDLKKLKAPKVPVAKADLKSQIKELEDGMIEKPSTVQEKLTELEKQVKEMSGPETRVDNPIEKELNELQKKIDELSPNKSNPDQSEAASKTNPSIQDLLSNLLNNPNSENSKIAPNNFLAPSEQHSGHPPIFALPFCLQSQPESHPYPGKIPSTKQFPKPAPVFEQEPDFACNCDKVNHGQTVYDPKIDPNGQFPYPGPVQPNYHQPGPISNVHRGDIHSGPITDHYQPIKPQHSYNAASSQSNFNTPVQKYENPQSNYNEHGPIKHQYQPIKPQDPYNAASSQSNFNTPVQTYENPQSNYNEHGPIKHQYQPIKPQDPYNAASSQSNFNTPVQTYENPQSNYNEHGPIKHQYQPIKSQDSYNAASSQSNFNTPVQTYENAQSNYNEHGPITHQYQPIKPLDSYNGASSQLNFNAPVQTYENAQSNYNEHGPTQHQYQQIKPSNYNGATGSKPNYNIYDMNIVAKKELVPYHSVDSNPNLNHPYAQSIPYSGDSNNKNPISLYSTGEKSFYVKPVINHDNNYKSIYEKYNNNGAVNMEQEIQKLGDILEGLNDKINKYPHQSAHYRKKRGIEDNNLVDVQQRLNFLREQVRKFEANPDYRNDSKPGFDSAIRAADYYSQASDQYDKKGYKVKKVHKFDKLFVKVLKFILHKLEISAPHIIESLFDGDSFTYEYDVDDSNYGSNYRSAGYENSGRSGQNLFDGLTSGFQGFPGLLGFIPTIIFKILSNFSFFLNILKRNTFFKNFLVPGALILVVDGIMAILIWWSSSDNAQNAISFVPNNQNYNNPSLNTYNSPYSNNINQYS